MNYIKKDVQGGELKIYQFFHNHPIKNLDKVIIPQALNIDFSNKTLILPYFEGKTFHDLWTIEQGGGKFSDQLLNEAINILDDLQNIALSKIKNSLPKNIEFKISHNQYFYSLAEKIIDQKDLIKVKEILSHTQTSPKILNNGDFYPLNFIQQEKQIVLIDWETFSPHSPFFNIDHIENVAAVLYAHMYKNQEWQTKFICKVKEKFNLNKQDIQKALLIKAITMSYFFPKHKNLVEGQKITIRNTLEIIN